MAPVVIVLVLLAMAVGGPALALLLWVKLRQTRTQLRAFAPILDVTAEVAMARARAEFELGSIRASTFAELAQLRAHAHSEVGQLRASVEVDVFRLREEDKQLRASIGQLTHQRHVLSRDVASLEERYELQQIALYSHRYHFAHSDDYKRRLEDLVEEQKALFKAKRAAWCLEEWKVNGSRAEGKKVTDKVVKLMLRAFNGECDALIAKVRYDNVHTYEARIRKSFEDINKLGSGFSCALTEDYFNLKLQELFLTHECQEKLQAEREEQRELKEQMREEQRALQELERAQREAEKEATRYTNALDRARAEAEAAVGARQDKLVGQIAELEQRLRETEEQQRAISMAQQTRRGHVYILSNIGSFGENVYKIGMTRRLDPQDRVDELGDASVPFAFDVHAMIKTDDAPRLERVLHQLFDQRRLNRINQRKEFFRATIEELERVVREHHGEFQLTRYAEAAHYRQSIAIETQAAPQAVEQQASAMVSEMN